jgi:hypothetical protein
MDHSEDATREDREDAARKMWRYAADPVGKEAFEDDRTLEVGAYSRPHLSST